MTPSHLQHVIITNGSFLEVTDGSIITLRRLASYVRSRGVQATVLCSASRAKHPLPEGVISVPSIPLPVQSEYRFPFRLTRQAKAAISKYPNTLVHVGAPDGLGIAAQRFARRLGLPAVASFHSNIVSYFKYLSVPRVFEHLGWTYFRWFYRQFDQVYVPTQSMIEELDLHTVNGNFLLWPRGVDATVFNPSHRSEVWRRELGIDAKEVVALFVARLKWEKGLKVLTEVCRRIQMSSKPIRTVIVGDGVGYAPLRAELPASVFTRELTGDALSTAYASADLFFYPSTTDTFGNVTLEAMASGLPTVCADAPGSKSLVQNGITGFLVDAADIDGFVSRILHLSADADLRRSMARSALRAAQSYSWEKTFDTLWQYYIGLTGQLSRDISPDSAYRQVNTRHGITTPRQ